MSIDIIWFIGQRLKEILGTKMDNFDPARKLKIISHMNEDHSDACLLYASQFAKFRQAKSAEMIDVSFSQITLRVSGEVITVDFPRVAKSTEDIRSVLVEMVKLAKRN